eukprot:190865-Amphidinium_carterae.3
MEVDTIDALMAWCKQRDLGHICINWQPVLKTDTEKVMVRRVFHWAGMSSLLWMAGVWRLHRCGDRHFVPGRDYARYEVCGEELPDAGCYHKICRLCFKQGLPRDGSVSSDGSTEEDSDVSSE